MTGTRAVIAAVGVALLLGVAACSGDDPEPRVAPPSSSAPSSPSTSPAAASLGAEEAVRGWIQARNEAMQSGDLSAVRALTAPDCSSCDGILDPIAQVYDKGGHFETAGWRVVASRIKTQAARTATVPTALSFAGGRTVPEAGAEPVVYESEKHIVIFKLEKIETEWRVKSVVFLS